MRAYTHGAAACGRRGLRESESAAKARSRPNAIANIRYIRSGAPVLQASANTDRPLFQARCAESGGVHGSGMFSGLAVQESSEGLTDDELEACRIAIAALSKVESVDLEAPTYVAVVHQNRIESRNQAGSYSAAWFWCKLSMIPREET